MTKKICFMGDSHVAALKLAYEQLRTSMDVPELVFFAARLRGYRHVRLDGASIVPVHPKVLADFELTSGGQKRIELSDYDGYVLCGLDSFIGKTLPISGNYCTDLRGPEKKTLVSKSFFEAMLGHAFDQELCVNLLKMLRSVDAVKPIWLIPTPLRSQKILEQDVFPRLQKFAESEQLAMQAASHYQSALRQTAARYSAKCVLQPSPTIVHSIFTRPEFHQSNDKNTSDYAHMNAEYGKIMVRELIKEI